MKRCMWMLPFVTVVPLVSATVVNSNDLLVAKTITLADGSIVDWVYRSSQGTVADRPPFPPTGSGTGGPRGGANGGTKQPRAAKTSDYETFSPNQMGPINTVPILRTGEIGDLRSKALPDMAILSKRTLLGMDPNHWYAGTRQSVWNLGAKATFSCFRPELSTRRRMSLLQMSVARTSVPGVPGRKVQTLEAGWMRNPRSVRHPHMFTYYTVNSYVSPGDYRGGYNAKVKGWVQVDREYYPGMRLPVSRVGGVQRSVRLRFRRHRDNWWLAVNDRWIGYYPGRIFWRRGVPSDRTLASKSNYIAMYGEATQEKLRPWPLTRTQMGSGKFPEEGWGRAAYIRQMTYTDLNRVDRTYTGPSRSVTEPMRYDCMTNELLGDSFWGSYMFVGGPGRRMRRRPFFGNYYRTARPGVIEDPPENIDTDETPDIVEMPPATP